LLDLLVEAINNARILLLVNYPPEYRHDWGGRTHYTQLRLDPLGRETAAAMLSALVGDEAELEPLKHLIADRTQGNPFSWKKWYKPCSNRESLHTTER
jgi:predicted ATPase